jgi:hypothetical protein
MMSDDRRSIRPTADILRPLPTPELMILGIGTGNAVAREIAAGAGGIEEQQSPIPILDVSGKCSQRLSGTD